MGNFKDLKNYISTKGDKISDIVDHIYSKGCVVADKASKLVSSTIENAKYNGKKFAKNCFVAGALVAMLASCGIKEEVDGKAYLNGEYIGDIRPQTTQVSSLKPSKPNNGNNKPSVETTINNGNNCYPNGGTQTGGITGGNNGNYYPGGSSNDDAIIEVVDPAETTGYPDGAIISDVSDLVPPTEDGLDIEVVTKDTTCVTEPVYDDIEVVPNGGDTGSNITGGENDHITDNVYDDIEVVTDGFKWPEETNNDRDSYGDAIIEIVG